MKGILSNVKFILHLIVMLPVFLLLGMRHAQASGSTALGDTVKTSIGQVLLPTTAKRVVGFWGYALGGAGNTTLENVSGILELESDSLNLSPMQFPLDLLACTGTLGMAVLSPRVWPVNIPNVGGVTITGYMTLDMAQSIGNTGRWGLIYEEN